MGTTPDVGYESPQVPGKLPGLNMRGSLSNKINIDAINAQSGTNQESKTMKIFSKNGLITQFFVVILVGAFWVSSAQAVPNFARQYDKKCSYCHSAWPQLNAKGRQFKELGYRIAGEEV